MRSREILKTPTAREATPVISPEVRIAAAQAVLSEGDIDVSEVLRDRREETLALVQRLLISAGVQITFSTSKNDEPAEMDVKISEAIQPELQSNAEIKRELTLEQKELLFTDLRTNFKNNMILHRGLKWEDVQHKLEKSPAATLVTLHKMQARGGEPTVTDFDQKTGKYRFDDCSDEIPMEGRKTTYAQAEQMAQDMRVDLMEPDHYKNKFQKLGKRFDRYSWNWLRTTKEKLKTGKAFDGDRHDHEVFVYECNAVSYDDRRGFRASLWV